MMEEGVNYRTVYDLVIPYLTDTGDRAAASLVCSGWNKTDCETRKNATVGLCYTVSPSQVFRRFPFLHSLKVKGKPHLTSYGLIPGDWGGYATPWVEEIARMSEKVKFFPLKSLHLRRMVVTDGDLENLAQSRGKILEELKLCKCSGFSTDGLLHVTRCRSLTTLSLELSDITDNDGQWLHEIALNHTALKRLNFYFTYLFKIDVQDLELIARRCPLISLKVSDIDLLTLTGFFKAALSLEEFAGGDYNYKSRNAGELNEQVETYSVVSFPPKLCDLGLNFVLSGEMLAAFPFVDRHRKLDLLFVLLSTEHHCQLLRRCFNLEILETKMIIGDRGLKVLGHYCKRLRRLCIEAPVTDYLNDENGHVTGRGLISLAMGCTELQYIKAYVVDITNKALVCIGRNLQKLQFFRLALCDQEQKITDLPLDQGVRSLLIGCSGLRKFGLHLSEEALTKAGFGFIGAHSPNITWLFLGRAGGSDDGLDALSRGCPNLQKLELVDCYFSERAIAAAALLLRSLKYLQVKGYKVSPVNGQHLLSMCRPFWNIELIPSGRPVDDITAIDPEAQIIAFYTTAGQRTDFPPSVVPFLPVAAVDV